MKPEAGAVSQNLMLCEPAKHQFGNFKSFHQKRLR
jgi:hypothetical protein